MSKGHVRSILGALAAKVSSGALDHWFLNRFWRLARYVQDRCDHAIVFYSIPAPSEDLQWMIPECWRHSKPCISQHSSPQRNLQWVIPECWRQSKPLYFTTFQLPERICSESKPFVFCSIPAPVFIDFWTPVAIASKGKSCKQIWLVTFSLISGPRWPLEVKENDIKIVLFVTFSLISGPWCPLKVIENDIQTTLFVKFSMISGPGGAGTQCFTMVLWVVGEGQHVLERLF